MKLLKYIGILGAFSLPLVSCSDFLDAENKSVGGVDGNDYIASDPSRLKSTTFNAYKDFITDINLQDLSTDLFASWRASNDGEFALFSFGTDNKDISNYYKNVYNAINYANAMIQFAGADSELGAQGRFMRALGYYYLTQQFGSVPFLTTYIESSSRDYPRTPLAEIYSALVADLTEVYNTSSLPATNHAGEVSKQAVAALIAKIELAAGWDIDTSLVNAEQGEYRVNDKAHFAQAAIWADRAIDNTPLTMTFEEKWSPFNQNNNEVIFQINYERTGFLGDEATGGHSLQNNYIGYVDGPDKTGQKANGSGGTNMAGAKALRLFTPGDSRFNGTFMTTFYNATKTGSTAAWGTQGYYAYYNATDVAKSTMPYAAVIFPYYTTEAEVEAFLDANAKDHIKLPDGKKYTNYGIQQPYACICDPEGVIVYSFNIDGTYTKSTPAWNAFTGRQLNGPFLKKFDDPNSIQSLSGNDYRNVVLLHVSQMYLVAAEAYYMSDNETAALARINSVRDRAGAPRVSSFGDYASMIEYVTPSSFAYKNIDLILDELARECYAERTRFADLRRTKQLIRYNLAFSRGIVSANQMANSKGEFKWYRPIPQAEINANTSISLEDQNPGY